MSILMWKYDGATYLRGFQLQARPAGAPAARAGARARGKAKPGRGSGGQNRGAGLGSPGRALRAPRPPGLCGPRRRPRRVGGVAGGLALRAVRAVGLCGRALWPPAPTAPVLPPGPYCPGFAFPRALLPQPGRPLRRPAGLLAFTFVT